MGRVNKYSEEFRRQAMLVLDARLPVREVARELDVNHETLRNDGTVIGQPSRGFSNLLRAASVTDTAKSVFPTSIATATVEGVIGAA